MCNGAAAVDDMSPLPVGPGVATSPGSACERALSPMAPYVLSARSLRTACCPHNSGRPELARAMPGRAESRVAHGRRAPVVRGERTSFGLSCGVGGKRP